MVFENTRLGMVIEKLVEIAPQLNWSRLLSEEHLLDHAAKEIPWSRRPTILPEDDRFLEKFVGSKIISFLLENKDKLTEIDLIDSAFYLERLGLPMGDRMRIEANLPGGEHFYVPNSTRGGCELTRKARLRLISPYFHYDIGEKRLLELGVRSNKEFCAQTQAFAYSVMQDTGWELYRFFFDTEEDEIIARIGFPVLA